MPIFGLRKIAEGLMEKDSFCIMKAEADEIGNEAKSIQNKGVLSHI